MRILYRVVGRFGNEEYRIGIRKDRMTPIHVDDEEEDREGPGLPLIKAERLFPYNGLFSTYEIAVCVMCSAQGSLKLVDLKIEEVIDGCL